MINNMEGRENPFYTMKDSYEILIFHLPYPPQSKSWGEIWNKDGLLKDNTSCWELGHGNILIAKNLIS